MSILDKEHDEKLLEDSTVFVEEVLAKSGAAGDIIIKAIKEKAKTKSAPEVKVIPKLGFKELFRELFAEGLRNGAFVLADKEKILNDMRKQKGTLSSTEIINNTIRKMKVAIKKHTACTVDIPTRIPGIPPEVKAPNKYSYYMISIAEESDGHATAHSYFLRVPVESLPTGYNFNVFMDTFCREMLLSKGETIADFRVTSTGWSITTNFDATYGITMDKLDGFSSQFKQSATVTWEYDSLWVSTD